MNLVFEGEQGQMIIWGEDDDFRIISEKMVDQHRWTTFTEVILQQQSTGNYYKYLKETGSTEYQDLPRPDKFELVRVYPKEIVVTVYEEKKNVAPNPAQGKKPSPSK